MEHNVGTYIGGEFLVWIVSCDQPSGSWSLPFLHFVIFLCRVWLKTEYMGRNQFILWK